MDDTAALVATLAGIVADNGPTSPRRIGEACVAALPVDGAAITVMVKPDRQEPIWVSDDEAGRLQELQFSLGEGPCVEAVTERRPVLVPDLRAADGDRWPVFAAAARRTSTRAIFALPLQAGAICVGVLDLYRRETGMLGPSELAGALRGADAALWSLLGLRSDDGHDGTGTDAWLAGAPLRHTEVYQATGMVMVQLGVTPEVALSRLRAFAFVRDRAIDEVARDVVSRRLRFDEEERG